jgi:hypothetical protein
LSAALIEPLTVIGRPTAFLLRLKDPERVTIRANLLRQGRYAPPPHCLLLLASAAGFGYQAILTTLQCQGCAGLTAIEEPV